MGHKYIWAARQDRPKETYTPVSVSVIADNFQAVAGVSFSASDAEYVAIIAKHLLDAAATDNFSLLESCSETLKAFCEKFVQEGVAHE